MVPGISTAFLESVLGTPPTSELGPTSATRTGGTTTTLIAVYTSHGCVGRCDAKCYDAEKPECTCICGGRNHGVGRNRAIANTAASAEQWIEHHRAANPDREYRYHIPQGESQQLELA